MNRISLGLLGAALVTSAAFAQSPVGRWSGQIIVTPPKIPANISPQQKAMFQKQLAQIRAMRLTLVFKSDGTYQTEIPGTTINGRKVGGQSQKGTWKQSGKKITLTTSNPQVPVSQRSQSGTMSNGGRVITVIAQSAPGYLGKPPSIVFRKV